MTRIADAAAGVRHVFVRDLVLLASIGVYPAEREAPQRVRINIDLGVEEGELADSLDCVLDYSQVVQAVRGLVAAGHVGLVETLAERIAQSCLADPRVRLARIRVEKLDVFPDAVSAGVEVERWRKTATPSREI